MFERLQTVQQRVGESQRVIQATKLVIDNVYADVTKEFVEDAHSEIRMCAYSWKWYENEPELSIQKLNIALWAARTKGVKVRCLVDTVTQEAFFRQLGFDVRCVVNTRMLHTKAIGIDDKTVIIGSHNMTKRANADNFEMSILTQEPSVVLDYNEYFDRMWNSRG